MFSLDEHLSDVAETSAGADRVAPSPANHDADPAASHRVLVALRRIIRSVDLHSRQLTSCHGITTPQLVCLRTIGEHEPLTVTAIARRVHLSSSTVIGILDRMEGKGLIGRERDRVDRRLVHVTLTVAGRELVTTAPSPLQARLERALDRLDAAGQQEIAGALERVVALMEAGHLDAAPMLQTGPLTPEPGPDAPPSEPPPDPGAP